MEKFKILIQLTRLNKPIGFMLLFWPCAWGLTLAYHYNLDTNLYIRNLFLFFLGSVLMRSAGCIVNDIIDKDFDKKVKRTKKRPIAAGKISIAESFFYVIIFCLLSLTILLQFNKITIILGLISMFPTFLYPFMKRITYWPQLFLGLTFSWGIIMGWTSIMNNISAEPFVLYLAAIFWTLGYDTVYGLQDMKDDETIGIKSTSIKFKNNVKLFTGICYGICVFLILILASMIQMNKIFFLLSIFFILSFFYQLKILKIKIPKTCLHAFKTNNLTGFLIYILIFSFTFP